MRRRTWDRHGMVVHRGRYHTRPFGVVGEWPSRHEDLGAMSAAESAANERRAAYRAWEAAQPCSGCGQPGPGHAPGCIWR